MTQTKNRGVSCSRAVFIRCSALNRGVVHVWHAGGLGARPGSGSSTFRTPIGQMQLAYHPVGYRLLLRTYPRNSGTSFDIVRF